MAQKTPDAPEPAPLKPCTPLVGGLIVLAALLHQVTHGYGSAICLLLIAIWLIVRCVKGLKTADREEPMEDVETWLF